jgi:hypothetical protein
MNRRIRKKRHRQWLASDVIDLGLRRWLRARLFAAGRRVWIPIDRDHLAEVPPNLATAIRRFGLAFEVARIEPERADRWLSIGGLEVFRFRAQEFPEVYFDTGNAREVF